MYWVMLLSKIQKDTDSYWLTGCNYDTPKLQHSHYSGRYPIIVSGSSETWVTGTLQYLKRQLDGLRTSEYIV